jgi:hypothetical protein
MNADGDSKMGSALRCLRRSGRLAPLKGEEKAFFAEQKGNKQARDGKEGSERELLPGKRSSRAGLRGREAKGGGFGCGFLVWRRSCGVGTERGAGGVA